MTLDLDAINARTNAAYAYVPDHASLDAQVHFDDVSELVDEVQRLWAQNAELLLLLGLVQQARNFGHVHELLDEFRKAPDFPLSPPSAVLESPAGGEAGGAE